jgi:regulator of sigma E protease
VSYIYAFLGFAALVILHETGHFLAAKAVGMRVERFSLFFGPPLVKVRRGETEYGIGPIPLGGYVKITGMNPREERYQQQDLDELREQLTEIEGELAETPPDDEQRRHDLRGQEEETSRQIAAGQAELEEIRRRAYYNQPVWKRVVVILAGPVVNLLLAFVIVWALYLSIGQPVATKQVAAVQHGSPAATVLQRGDRIISVDGVSGSPAAIHSAIAKHRCPGAQVNGCRAATPARVVVERHGRRVSFTVRPRYSASEHTMLVGFLFAAHQEPVSVGQAASLGGQSLWAVTKATLSAVAHLFHPKPKQRLSSVVGAYKVTQESFAASASQAFWVLALISLSLAIINLFPFLPLDGGHVFWAVAEKIRGRRIPFSVMERASAVGFVLIIIVFMIGLSNDVSTLSGSGFNVH